MYNQSIDLCKIDFEILRNFKSTKYVIIIYLKLLFIIVVFTMIAALICLQRSLLNAKNTLKFDISFLKAVQNEGKQIHVGCRPVSAIQGQAMPRRGKRTDADRNAQVGSNPVPPAHRYVGLQPATTMGGADKEGARATCPLPAPPPPLPHWQA